MAIVEDITAEEDVVSSSLEDLLGALQALAKALQVPEKVFHGTDDYALNQYTSKAFLSIKQMAAKIKKVDEEWGWEEVSTDQQAQMLAPVIRLCGKDAWSSESIRREINGMKPHLPKSLPLTLLPTLRPYFASHPSLSSASRPLTRPTGGTEGTIDLHDVQPFKDPSAWGIANIISWSASHLTEDEIERHLGIVLPPTLVLMDDYEPAWREKGVLALESWIFTLASSTIRSMRLHTLLLPSLVHSLALHPHPPLPSILPITLRVLHHTTDSGSEERGKWIAEIMEKRFVDGWMYAKDGKEGRETLVNLAEELEVMCKELGTGIVRWLKQLIPNLLNPLQYSPSPLMTSHYTANLSALLAIIHTIRPTGLITRWRGKIINVLGRQWILCKERRGLDSEDDAVVRPVMELIQKVLGALAEQLPVAIPQDLDVLRSLAPGHLDDLVSSSCAKPLAV
ncbi:hypothetical protein IAR50_004312 [Cryptococcus sp. DSM 104548]